jgi:phage I-like protein
MATPHAHPGNTPPRPAETGREVLGRNDLALNALSLAIDGGEGRAAPTSFRVLPLGAFAASDGRDLKGAAPWCLSVDGAQALAAAQAARASDTVIDYEHQLLLAASNGQPVPAAGWYNALTLRDDGLYIEDARWTDKAAAMIAAREYRYISPVFLTHKTTGEVVKLINVTLTNTPGLDGLTDLNALSARLILGVDDDSLTLEQCTMNELLEQMRWMLDLPVGSTQDDVVAQLQKIINQIKTAQAAQPEALRARVGLSDLLTAAFAAPGEINALKAQVGAKPDPAQYVEIATVNALRAELASASGEVQAMKAARQADEVNSLVAAALTAKKLTPALEAWARDLGNKDIAALKTYIDAALPVLPGTQTGGIAPLGAAGNDAEALRVAALKYQTEQAAAGHELSWAAAVEHVSTHQGA